MTDVPYTSLELELRALAPMVAFPATPDLASAVGTRLRTEGTSPSTVPRVRRRVPDRRTGLGWWPRVVAQVALGIVALGAVVLIASPAARAAVANVFRKVPGIRVIVGTSKSPTPSVAPEAPATASAPSSSAAVSAAPSPSPSSTTSSSSSVLPTGEPSPTATLPESPSVNASPTPPLSTDFGSRTTIAAARSRVPYPVLVPATLGPPDAVYFDSRVGRGMVTMRWKAGANLPDAGGGIGALLTQFDTATNRDFPYFLKDLGVTGNATFEYLQVNGDDGGWIEGGHQVEFGVPRADGVRQVVSTRLAANTLIWLHNGVTMRLETALSREAAIELAKTLI